LLSERREKIEERREEITKQLKAKDERGKMSTLINLLSFLLFRLTSKPELSSFQKSHKSILMGFGTKIEFEEFNRVSSPLLCLSEISKYSFPIELSLVYYTSGKG
jgi:hypothetical protein